MILPITEADDITKGMIPTANMLAGETWVEKIIISNGTILAGIASSLQFKSSQLTDKSQAYNN
jgi:hypothetical protein